MEFIVENGDKIRLIAFITLFTLFMVLQFTIRRRDFAASISDRLQVNIPLTLINSLLEKITLGALPLATAFYVADHKIGILQYLDLNPLLVIGLSVILLDMAIYFQHILTHKIDFLWKLHKVHHSDNDLDVSSGFRFHPLEIVFSLMFKVVAIFLIGATPAAVVIFGVLLNAGSLFNHSNIKIPDWLEKYLNLLVVTPKVHLVHHSTIRQEMNSNFGFTISCWDRIFKTYMPFESAQIPKIGLSAYDSVESFSLAQLLKMPFK